MTFTKTTGSNQTPALECINPKKNIWLYRCNYENTDAQQATYYEVQFNHEPTEQEQKDTYDKIINQIVQETILSGFRWNGYTVWLSQTNQQNYKAAADIALQTDGQNLPFTAKFENDKNETIFYNFTTTKELTQFYYEVNNFIQQTLQQGWNKKH